MRTIQTIRDFTTLNESTPFDRGSGHVDPNKALDPGLVYDIGVNEYIGFLCSIGYTESRISIMVHDENINCFTMGLASPGDLNYPSFSVVFKPAINKVTPRRVEKLENIFYGIQVSSIGDVVSPSRLKYIPANKSLADEVAIDAGNMVTHRRVLKNVGKLENVVYDVKVSSPPSIDIVVSPSRLVFSSGNQILSYEVTFIAFGDQIKDRLSKFGWIEWSDGFHRVQSPVAITWEMVCSVGLNHAGLVNL